MASDLCALVHRLGRPRVLVVGDVILDQYVFGTAERMSQEAPVPVLLADQREERLGGAASVASMLAVLGAEVHLLGVVGADVAAAAIGNLLDSFGINKELLLVDGSRPTTLKQRCIGRAQDRHPQQILRIDFEAREPLSSDLEAHARALVGLDLRGSDIVLVSDYAKGVCTRGLLRHLIDHAAARRIVIDPFRGKNYDHYRGAACLTPNRTEVQLATSLPATDPALALRAGEVLRDRLDAEAVVVTLDKDGMVFAHRDGRQELFPTRPRQVYDITGAGDMVLAVLGLALASGASYEEGIMLANVASGLAVERLGVATLTRDDLLSDLATSGKVEKVLALADLLPALDYHRRRGERIVFTNGCFDLLHLGHVSYLQQARALGDRLVVGLNSDASVRRLKGSSRPLNDGEARSRVLAGLEAVDYTVIFEEDTPLELIRTLKPDVLVKGADYRVDQVVGREIVEAYGGRLVLIPIVEGHSSTRLAAALKSHLP
jgi:D-beta-D-heptose 7-phosphate kinase/D-beta-D-heptose 1-phosphate adenosyltransferase